VSALGYLLIQQSRSEAALEASAVADPHTTVKADVQRLLGSALLTPKVSVSGHVYDIATGRVTTALDARYPERPRP
jgi:carbonic anhydrase